jgi:hypothetical protein
MLWHSVVSLVVSIVVPPLVRSDDDSQSSTPHPTSSSRRRAALGGRNDKDEPRWLVLAKRFLPSIPFQWLTLPLLWAVSNAVFSVLLIAGTWTAKGVGSASFVVAAAGFCWAVTNWAPFAIVSCLSLLSKEVVHPGYENSALTFGGVSTMGLPSSESSS